MADRSYSDALASALRSGGDALAAIPDVGASLVSGMIAQPVAGYRGIADLIAGNGLAHAADTVGDTMERFTRAPRTDVGERGLENIGGAFQKAGDFADDYLLNHVANIPGVGPELATAAVMAANVIGPKGARAPKLKVVRPHIEPRFDPGSVQQLIPGLEPLTLDEAHGRALGNLNAAREAMTFEDTNRGMRFDYDPDWRGGGPAYEVNMRDAAEGSNEGKRPVGRVTQRPVPFPQLEGGPSTRTVPQGDFVSPDTVQAGVGSENYQRMMALVDKLRGAEDEAHGIGEQAANTRSRELNERIARRRALLQEPDINPEQRLTLEEEILGKMRRLPIEAGGRTLVPEPSGEGGQFSALRYRDLFGDERSSEAAAYLREHPALAAQARIVRRLRGLPEEQPYEPRRPAPNETLPDIEGRDPSAMSREAVDAFLLGGRGNESLFQYGTMPGRDVQSLEDFAKHFSEQSGERLRVDHDYADNDEPSKIKVEKEHGRGEVMLDRHGEPKLAGAEEGQIKYDDRGNPVTKEKEVELPGPLEKGEEGPLIGTKEIEKTVPEGDYYRNEDGDYVYRKSEGGEPVRDERGRVKYEERDNPDYSGNEFEQATISSPHGHIEITYDDPATIHATEAGKKGGQLLYQTALAHASRAGIDIGGGSLTDINAYRLLSNTLSNIARTGKNPRDLAGTSSGRAPRARGQAEGPEVWRAEAEEGRSRLLMHGVDPDRVKFNPDKGFTIDGKPASPDDVKANIGELSPKAGSRERGGGVGQKSLMRNAVFEWLRHATPEQAKAVAEKWPEEWGPIFAGIAALGLGVGAMEKETADENL